MSKKWFGKKDTLKESQETSSESVQKQALLNAIAEKKKENPLLGMKIGSQEVVQRLIQELQDEKGVHIESLLAVLGSLAGYSCHMASREELVNSEKHLEKEVFTVISGADGKNYYFGDLPNKYLVENQYSIWRLIVGITQHLQEQQEPELPDINSIFSHVSSTVGGHEFGIPRISEKHKPRDLPINYVTSMWTVLLPIIDKFCENPMERPILLGLAIQQLIEMGKDIISPLIAAEIVMECAIPMSKIGPEWLKKHD